MYAYCNSNPIVCKDSSGNVVETVFDIASLVFSAVEVAINPTDISAWVGLVGDAVDLIPFVTGVGETIRALRISSKITEGADTVIDTYRNLSKLNKGTGMEVHHILEKRFVDQLKLNIGNTDFMHSIRLSKDAHKQFTKDWRINLPYGHKYDVQDVLKAAVNVYSDDPTLMGVVLFTLNGGK